MSAMIEFTVEGLPPKKYGANSMWRKATEIPRLIALREKAYEALGGHSSFTGRLKLTLILYSDSNTNGDLDNFITGICDGLMAADGKTPIDEISWPVNSPIHPSKKLIYFDDRDIYEIIAARRPSDGNGNHYYIKLEAENWQSSLLDTLPPPLYNPNLPA
ncbi:MAG: hypothetical protein KF821_01385 [Anaerolineales bacterium]|nr:hypothetical protein [Anaerolineales bacterium]